MRISSGQKIAGVDAVVLRDARRVTGPRFGAERLASFLKLEADEATGVLNELASRGIVEHDDSDPPVYRRPLQGNALCNATAAKPVSRKVAQRVALKGA